MLKPWDKLSGFTWVLVVLTTLAWCSACGKKAPPMAPREPAMAAVEDLKAEYQEGAVALVWHHQPATSSAITGYQVYRAGRENTLPACPGCPQLFEKIEIVTLDPARSDTRHPLSYTQVVANGFRYTYKVVPTQPSGALGPDSNLVNVDAFQ